MKHSFYLAAGICLIFAMSACQGSPQPSSERSTEELEASMQETGTSTAESNEVTDDENGSTLRDQTPLTYKDTWTAGNLTWEIDAEVVVPDRESMPKATGTLQLLHLNEEIVDRTIKVFFGDRDYYTMDYSSDHDELFSTSAPDDTFDLYLVLRELDQSRRTIAELAQNKELFSEEDYDRIYNDNMERINSNTELLKSIDYLLLAKNQYKLLDFVYSDGIKNKSFDKVVVCSSNDNFLGDRLEIASDMNTYRNYLRFNSYDPNHDYDKPEEEMSFSRNQAIERCEEYLQALGIDFLEVREIRFEYGYYKVIYGLKEETLVPSLPGFSRGDLIWLHAEDTDDSHISITGIDFPSLQMGFICLDENHILNAYLPLTELVIEENGSWSELTSFEEMISELKANFAEAASSSPESRERVMHIDRIYLTNTFVQTSPAGDADGYGRYVFQSIPVWLFAGEHRENLPPVAYSEEDLLYTRAWDSNPTELYAYYFACDPEEVTFTNLDFSAEMDQYAHNYDNRWYRRGRCSYFTGYY